MARLLDGLAIAFVVAQEDVFQAGFVTGQADDGMLRRRLDHRVRPTLHRQAQRMPTGQRLHLLHTVQRLESLGRHDLGKGDDNFVALDVFQLGHAAHPHQLPFTNDAHASARLFDLAQDVRGQKDGAPLVAHFLDHAVKLLLVQRVQAASWLIQNQQARAVHKGLNDPDLALVAARILAELAAGIQIESLDELLEIGLIDASAQVPEVFQNLPAGQAGVERKLAWQIADQPLDLHRLLPAVQPGNARCAGVGAQQRHEQANRGGFARAVGAKEAKHLALFHAEGDVGNAALAAVALGQTLYFYDRCHDDFLLLFRPLFGFLDFIEILGKELFAYIALAGELLRLQPAAYQVAERLRQLLHGWQVLLTDDIRRVDHANLQSGQQIGDDGSRKICADQPGLLKLVKIGIGIAYEPIEKAWVIGPEKPVEDV